MLHVQGLYALGPVDLADAIKIRGDERLVGDRVGVHHLDLAPCRTVSGATSAAHASNTAGTGGHNTTKEDAWTRYATARARFSVIS